MTRESLLILPDTNLADLLTLERSFFFSLARTMLILPGVSGTVAMNWMCWPHVVAKCARSQIEGGGHDDGECFARERCAEQREGLVRVEVWKCVRIALELLVALRSPSCLAAGRGDGRRSDPIRRPSHSHSFAAIASVSRWVSRTRPRHHRHTFPHWCGGSPNACTSSLTSKSRSASPSSLTHLQLVLIWAPSLS